MTYLLLGGSAVMSWLRCVYLAGAAGSLARASGCVGFNVCILAVAPVAV